MTATTTSTRPPKEGLRRSALDRSVAMRLAATEYHRFLAALEALTPEEWSASTCCAGWDVRTMASHILGMEAMAASIREGSRQQKLAGKRGGLFIDALTGLQVDERADLGPDELTTQLRKTGPKAARGRRRTPGFIRRRALPIPQEVNGTEEWWTIGYMIDSILTRDPWMHRSDLAAATGRPMQLTADHDGVLVADVVAEWASRHGKPFALRLTGPAGGTWSIGNGGPEYELDAIQFCRVLSGRAPAEGLLATQVPF